MTDIFMIVMYILVVFIFVAIATTARALYGIEYELERIADKMKEEQED